MRAADGRNPFARDHSERVARCAAATAKKLSFSPREVEELEIAGYLHDIGKMQIPETIIGKIEPLSSEESEAVEEHPRLGREMLSATGFSCNILPAVAHHHERYAGGGYPSALVGDEISQGARIVAVADAFDGLISGRPGQPALALNPVFDELRKESGVRFDPLVVEAFIDAVKQEPSLAVSPSHTFFALLK